MAMKKVTVEDLMSIRGGGKVEKAEKKAIKQISKETGQKAGDLRKKNEDQKGKEGTPVNDPGRVE
jgi:hypothetical protein